MIPSKIFALIKKDFLNELSYKTAFALNFLAVAANLLIYFYIDKLFGHTMTPHLEQYGVTYFSYILLSLALFHYIGVGVGSFSHRIRQEQMQGTLEALFMTPTRITTILAGMGLWQLIFATLNMMIYIMIGIIFFKIDFTQVNLISSGLILILSIVTFSSLGIMAASCILIFKRGNPVDWLINTVEGILGGVFFPLTVLPPVLQKIAHLLPMTYAIRGLQLAVYQGYSVNDLWKEMIILLLFAIILIPLAIATFRHALTCVRRQGSLGQY